MEDIKKYIDNPLFLKWVFEPDSNIKGYWDYYITNHPEEEIVLTTLKNELEIFNFNNPVLTEERKKILLERIEGKIINKRKSVRIRKISTALLKYAAMAIIFISIGGILVYLYQGKRTYDNMAEFMEMPHVSDKPMIVLSDGSKYDLKVNESEVNYTSKNQMVINNDSIVELQNESEEINSSPIFQSIPYGYRSKIVLNDNSTVWLNAGSRLIYPPVFNGKEREVILFGEAFFEVKKDTQKPFIVRTADYSIKVLGTKFNVSAYSGDEISQTVLTEGSIELEINKAGWFDKNIVLEPNQMFSFNKKSNESNVYRVDPDKYVSWVDGLIKCENEDLNRVIKKLERFYNIQIKLNNPLDGTIKIDGKLNLKEDKQEVLYYVCKVAKRQFKQKNEGFYVIE